jgi:hypothetical protein
VQHYIFASPNTKDRCVLNSIESLESVCDEFFDVALSGKKELEILLALLGIGSVIEESLPASEDFSSLIDLSEFNIPELDKDEFDALYESWLIKTGRESNMDEYGQLIFIQGRAKSWNKRPIKVVLIEKP